MVLTCKKKGLKTILHDINACCQYLHQHFTARLFSLKALLVSLEKNKALTHLFTLKLTGAPSPPMTLTPLPFVMQMF